MISDYFIFRYVLKDLQTARHVHTVACFSTARKVHALHQLPFSWSWRIIFQAATQLTYNFFSFAWPSSSSSVFAIHFLLQCLYCVFREEYDSLFFSYMWKHSPFAGILRGAIFHLQGTSSLPTLCQEVHRLAFKHCPAAPASETTRSADRQDLDNPQPGFLLWLGCSLGQQHWSEVWSSFHTGRDLTAKDLFWKRSNREVVIEVSQVRSEPCAAFQNAKSRCSLLDVW